MLPCTLAAEALLLPPGANTLCDTATKHQLGDITDAISVSHTAYKSLNVI